ncbi:transketolase [Sesbania bispinosa]|nr:transketolase [Sesbania bispinosa]
MEGKKLMAARPSAGKGSRARRGTEAAIWGRDLGATEDASLLRPMRWTAAAIEEAATDASRRSYSGRLWPRRGSGGAAVVQKWLR